MTWANQDSVPYIKKELTPVIGARIMDVIWDEEWEAYCLVFSDGHHITILSDEEGNGGGFPLLWKYKPTNGG